MNWSGLSPSVGAMAIPTECIVDVLEPVEIETEHTDGFRASLTAEYRF
jgi:hypothetical protein